MMAWRALVGGRRAASRLPTRRSLVWSSSFSSEPMSFPELQESGEQKVGDYFRDISAQFGPVMAARGEVPRVAVAGGARSDSAPYSLSMEAPVCGCGERKVVRRVRKEGGNQGREFLTCPRPQESQCPGQFQWCDEPPPPTCSCGGLKVRRTVKKAGDNQGRDFFTCPRPLVPQCKDSFQWVEDEEAPPPPCGCGHDKVKRVVVKKGLTKGRSFYTCPNPTASTCRDSFQWVDQVEEQVEQVDQVEEREERVSGEEQEEEKKEEVRVDLRSLVVPACELFNQARSSLGDVEEEVLRIPFVKSSGLPSVTRILQATMSEESKMVLARWEARMVRQLGEEGFRQYKRETFARGHTLHRVVEEYLVSGEIPSIDDISDPVSRLHLLSFSSVRDHLSSPVAIESAVEHPELGYTGILDCVARYDDQLVLIDWKTSEKEKNTVADLYDNPLQLAAYLGAVNADPRYSHLGSNLARGAVCVVYNSGLPAHTHLLAPAQMDHYWSLWLERLEMFHRL